MTNTTIYVARKIITMNPNQPEVTHVAVREGRVLGAGKLADLEPWGDYTLDERFADKVLMPGFVEGHAHTMEGTLWRNVFCGWFDRMDPEGKVWSGVKSILTRRCAVGGLIRSTWTTSVSRGTILIRCRRRVPLLCSMRQATL